VLFGLHSSAVLVCSFALRGAMSRAHVDVPNYY
jgi:hypothetical protein